MAAAPANTRTKQALFVLLAVTLVVAIAIGWAVHSRSGDVDTRANNATVTAALAAGLTAQNANDITRAKTEYAKALAVDPGNETAHYRLGLIAQLANDPAGAETQYRATLASNPNNVSALYNLAILRTVANPQEAESLYRRVIALQPSFAAPHLNLGLLLESDGAAEVNRARTLDSALVRRPATPAGATPVASPSPQR